MASNSSGSSHLNLSTTEVDQARKAIEFLSSLCSGTSEVSHSSSSSNETFEAKADAVLSSLNRVRSGLTQSRGKGKGKKKFSEREEMVKLFPQFKVEDAEKKRPWTHHFVCLAYCDQTTIPTTTWQKDQLLSAGLGEKKITFDDVSCNAITFKKALLDKFPKLVDAGGYQLCKCRANSRELQPLSTSVMSSPIQLQRCGGNTRTYIRPLQKDLDLSEEHNIDVREKCIYCGIDLSFQDLICHIERCRSKSEKKDFISEKERPCNIDEADDDIITLSSGEETDDKIILHPSPVSPPYSPIPYSPLLNVSQSPELPPVPFLQQSETKMNNPVDLKSCIQELQSLNKIFTAPCLYLEFRRDFVLVDALKHADKSKFDPKNKLKVTFIGEAGEDTGGLTREFWRLLVSSASKEYFIGISSKTFQPDALALKSEVYQKLGQWIAMSVIQGGFGFPVLAPAIYEYMITGNINIPVEKEHIPDPEISLIVNTIYSAKTNNELQALFGDDSFANALYDAGYKKPVITLTLDDKQELMNVISTYHTLIKVKAQIDQFVKGLESIKIHSYMVKYPEFMKSLFVYNKIKLTADYIKKLFKIQFSEKESPCRLQEEATYMHFVDFLDECEDGLLDVTLEDVLIFFTGCDREPPLGFSRIPELYFLHDKNSTMATASTCSFHLRLPISHSNYSAFRHFMVWSFKEHGGIHVI